MKTFWKVTLLVIFVSGWWSLYGDMPFTPSPIYGFHAQYKAGGDKDFMGNGPGVAAQVSIQITSDKSQIKATLYLWAKETQSNYTLFESSGEKIIWTAPYGYAITAINSPQQTLSRQTYTDSNHDLDHFASAEGPVSRFEIMGDKVGDDDPYMNVFFREITVQLKKDFRTGDTICLLADNNKYLSRITRATEAIEAAKSQIDRACLFKVTVLDESAIGPAFGESMSTIALLANNNKYLSRIPGTTEAIEAAKSQIDAYCKFKYTFLDESTIALLADNNKYLNRTTRGSTNPIEATKSNIDNTCKFKVKQPKNCYEGSVDSIEAHFPGIPGIKNKLGFNIVSSIEFTGGTSWLPCKHLQGMARGQSIDGTGTPYLFFTKNGSNTPACNDAPNNPGELWIVKMGSRLSDGEVLGSNRNSGKPPASDSLVSIFPLDGKTKDLNGNTWPGWMHPGGVQLEDSVLAVAVYTPNSSPGGIMLIDFKYPEKPIYLKTITKFGDRDLGGVVNAVGLTQICSGANRGKYLFVCGGSGGSELIFGISSGYDLRDPNLTINLFGIVTIPDSKNRIGETINLVRDRDGKIYFISFTNDDDVPNSGTDRAWLFDVVGGDGGITDVTRGRYVILDNSPSGDYGDVKAAACAYVSPSGQLILYSACHSDYCRGIIGVPASDCRDGYVKMGEFASR